MRNSKRPAKRLSRVTSKRPGLKRQVFNATLCLTAGLGNSPLAVLANSPQPVFQPNTFAHVPTQGGWQGLNHLSNNISNHGASIAINQNLAHSTVAQHVGLAQSGLHWINADSGNHQSARGLQKSLQPLLSSVSGNDDLDLYSPVAQFAAGSLGGFHTISIDVGGKQQQIDLNTKLTGAELVAAQQILSGGKQQLVLDAQGVATGGKINLNNALLTSLGTALGGDVASLGIARGVTVIDKLDTLNLTGALINFGSISIRSASETINASSILNTGTISAKQDLTIDASSITNSGLINSANGNINFGNGSGVSGAAGDINFVGINGTIQAPKGNINFNSGNDNITIGGGNFFSQNLNFNAGTGVVNANLGQVSGVINGQDNVSHITAATANLNLGTITNSGDPTYYNTSGNIVIDGSIAATSGADLAIVASGNIVGNGGKLDTSNASGNGGSLTLIAGANFTAPITGSGLPDSGNTTISLANSGTAGNGSATGGYIDLSGTTLTGVKTNAPVTAVTTASTSGSGGNILMVAYAGNGGANTGSIVATATASQSKGANTIDSTGTIGGGNVIIIACGNSIQTQNIKATGGSNSGAIALVTATPSIAGNSLSIINGTVTGSYSIPGTTASGTAVSTGNLTAGTVMIDTAGALSAAKSAIVSAADIQLSAASIGTAAVPYLTNTATGGSISVTSNGTSPIYIKDSNTTNFSVSGGPDDSTKNQSIFISSQAAALNVGNLTFTNVSLTNINAAGNIVLNPNSSQNFQVGEIQGSGALGTGLISITAGGSILEGTNPDATPVIVGKTVTLTSTNGDIGTGAGGNPLTINGAILTANAGKGNVYINDLVQTTLNAGSAALTVGTTTPTGNYDVTGNGLAVAGAINGANIVLTAGPGTVANGPGTVVAINANIGSSKTVSATVEGSNGIIQSNAKASIQAQDVAVGATATGAIGSTSQPVLTKALVSLQINGSNASGGADAFVTQTGAVTLLASSNFNPLTGNLALTDSTSITVGGAVNFGNIVLTTPKLVIPGAGSISADNLTVQSSGALQIIGQAASKTVPVASTGTITVDNSLFLSGIGGAAASSITVGDAKTGALNPLQSALNSSASSTANLTINAKGNFTSSLSQIAVNSTNAAGGNININAAGLVTTGSPLTSALVITASGTTTAGNITPKFYWLSDGCSGEHRRQFGADNCWVG